MIRFFKNFLDFNFAVISNTRESCKNSFPKNSVCALYGFTRCALFAPLYCFHSTVCVFTHVCPELGDWRLRIPRHALLSLMLCVPSVRVFSCLTQYKSRQDYDQAKAQMRFLRLDLMVSFIELTLTHCRGAYAVQGRPMTFDSPET